MTTILTQSPSNRPSGQGSASTAPETIYELNGRLLVGTIVVLLVLGGSLYFWHAFQVRRLAGAMLVRAETLEQEEDWAGAADYLHRYVRIHTDDMDVRVRLAKVFDKYVTESGDSGAVPQATNYLLAVIGEADEDPTIRERLAELLLQQQRFTEATKEAKTLLEADPNNPVGLRVEVLAEFAEARLATQQEIQDICTRFEDILQRNPGDMQLASVLSGVYLDRVTIGSVEERNKMTDSVLSSMVEASDDKPLALLVRQQYRQRYDRAAAQEDIDEALELAPDDLRVLLTAGQYAMAQGSSVRQTAPNQADTYLAKATELFGKVIQARPELDKGYLGLGQTQFIQGKPKLAVATWANALRRVGIDNLELNNRLASQLVDLGRLDEAQDAVDRMDERVRALAPYLTRARRTALEALVALRRGKLLTAQGENRAAIHVLNPIVSSGTSSALGDRRVAQQVEAWWLLGRAHAALGEWDQSAYAYDQATELRGGMSRLLAEAGSAWINAGREGFALQRLELATAQQGETDIKTWSLLAMARLRRQTSLPPEKRDWRSIDQQIADAPDKITDRWQYKLLAADVVLAKQGADAADAAITLFKEAEALDSDDSSLLQRLVLGYQRLGSPAAADRVLVKLEKALGTDSVACHAIRADLQLLRSDVDGAVTSLESAIAVADESQKAGLRMALARLYDRANRRDDAEKVWRAAEESNPSSITHLQQLFRNALTKGNWEQAQRWEDAMRESEGESGTQWRLARARRLLVQASKKPKDQRDLLYEASGLQQAIELQRPYWSAGYALKGQIAAMHGDNFSAVTALERAVELGKVDTNVVRLLVSILYDQKQTAEAEKYLAKARRNWKEEEMSAVALAMAVRTGDTARALTLAREIVARAPTAPESQLQLAQVLELTKDVSGAEAAFRKALEVAPHRTECWEQLFSFLLRQKRRKEAAALLTQMEAEPKLKPAERAFAAGRGYERLGQPNDAANRFDMAQRLAPENVGVQVAAARFFTPRNRDKAEAILRSAFREHPNNNGVRQELAKVLAATGDDGNWRDAMDLLGKGPSDNAIRANQRLAAELLIRRGRDEDREQAKNILEQLVSDTKTRTAQDRLRQAAVLEQIGDWPAAKKVYEDVIRESDPVVVAHAAAFIEALMRQDEVDTAATWIEKLEEQSPAAFATIALRVQWLKERDRQAEIEPALDAFVSAHVTEEKVPDVSQRANLYQAMGDLLARVDLNAGAERWYRKATQADPARFARLAGLLAKGGRVPETISLCREQAEKVGFTRAVDVLFEALIGKTITDSEYHQMSKLFEEAVAGNNDPQFLLRCSVFMDANHHYKDSVRLYEKMLSQTPDNIVLLNNLAFGLAQQEGMPRHDEALQYVDRAISLIGRKAAMLDTKAMVVWNSDPKAAVQLLEEATAGDKPAAGTLLHLAAAYQKQGKMAEAKESLQRARDAGLKEKKLSPNDHKLLEMLTP